MLWENDSGINAVGDQLHTILGDFNEMDWPPWKEMKGNFLLCRTCSLSRVSTTLLGTTDLFMKGWMGQILPWFLHYCEEINLRNSGSQRFKFSLFWQVMTCLGITGYTLDTSELWSQHCVNLEKGIRDRKVIRTPERKAGQIFSIYENGDLCFVQMLLRQNRECLRVWEDRLWRKSKTYSNNNILRKTAKCYPCSAEEYYYQ